MFLMLTAGFLTRTQVVADPKLGKSGVYWSWNTKQGSFENELSSEAGDDAKARKLFEVTEQVLGIKAPEPAREPAMA